MIRGFALTHIRVGHAGAHHGKRANPACSTGGFYTGPTSGQTVNANSPLNITWDTSCLDTKTVDIYLYAPDSTKSLVHEWENVQFASGSYLATLQPQWWNSTSSINLQLSIVQSGSPVFSSPMPAGPIFNATSSGSSITGGASEAGITNVGSVSVKHGLSGGKIAAAVIIPVLFIIGLCVAYYLKISRAKGRDESRRRSEAVDRRMSTVSTDWKPMSISGASAAVRNSLAYNNRASNFSFGAPRPSSDYTLDGGGGKAGIGTKGIYAYYTDGIDSASQMSHARSGSRPSITTSGDRVSRVSFAADPRPSADRRTTVVSRAYHNAFVPPVPSRNSHELSPFQTQGPFSLSQEDIRARVSSNSGGSGNDDVDVLPALTLMRTGDIDSGNEDDFILSRTPPPPALPTPPTPTHQLAKSPMTKQSVSVMSPDDLLRAYAARKVTSPTSSPGPGSLSYPAPAVNYGGNGMRILYSPTTPGSAPGSAVPMVRDMRAAYPYNEDDDEDAYAGTAF